MTTHQVADRRAAFRTGDRNGSPLARDRRQRSDRNIDFSRGRARPGSADDHPDIDAFDRGRPSAARGPRESDGHPGGMGTTARAVLSDPIDAPNSSSLYVVAVENRIDTRSVR